MKKPSVNANDKKALYFGGIILCIAVFYFVGWQMFHKNLVDIKTENDNLSMQVTELEQKEAQRETILAETDKLNQKTEKIVNQFPEKVTTEKVISDIVDMEEYTENSRVSSVSFVMNSLFYPQNTVTVTTEETANTDKPGYEDGVVTVYQSQAEMTIRDLSYKGLKNLVDFTNEYDGRLAIENLAVQFDGTTGKLTGTTTLNFYAMEGSPAKYKAPKITNVDLGLKNLFNTFEKKKK